MVHIDWMNKSGEISFLISTEAEFLYFHKFWCLFLQLIEQVAFKDLGFNKIYTYAYDLRPQLYKCLEECNFKYEKTVEDSNKKIIIHSKYNNND